MNMRCKQQTIFGLGLFCVALAFQTAGNAAAKIKCWNNKDGVRECGAMVPPEYAQQRVEVVNDKGQIIEVHPRALTPKELEAAKLAELERKKEQQREIEKKRQDLILLRTFTTERDLELSRKSKVEAIKGIIDITSTNTNTLQRNLQDLQKKAADFERSGQKPPKMLVNDMTNLKDQIKDNENFVAKKQQAIIRLEKKYDNDLARYRQLKSVKPR